MICWNALSHWLSHSLQSGKAAIDALGAAITSFLISVLRGIGPLVTADSALLITHLSRMPRLSLISGSTSCDTCDTCTTCRPSLLPAQSEPLRYVPSYTTSDPALTEHRRFVVACSSVIGLGQQMSSVGGSLQEENHSKV